MPAGSVSPVFSVAEALDHWRAGDRVDLLRSELLDVLAAVRDPEIRAVGATRWRRCWRSRSWRPQRDARLCRVCDLGAHGAGGCQSDTPVHRWGQIGQSQILDPGGTTIGPGRILARGHRCDRHHRWAQRRLLHRLLADDTGGDSDREGRRSVRIHWDTAHRIPDTAALRPAQVTLEAWILPVAFSSGFQSMIARGSSFGAAGAWKLGLQNGVPWFQVSVPGGGVIVQRPGPSVQLPLNRWTHIAGTFDGAIARLYLNGTSVAERRVAGDLSYEANPIPVTIAADTVNNAPDGLFIGRIDEVSLYRRALTAAEIVDIVVADFLGKSVARPYFTSERRLPNAVSGTAYSHQVVTILGAGPVTFRLSSGAMPPGVTLSSTGAISGTPGYPGRWGFTVVATDSSGQSTAQLFVLEVQ